MVWTRPNVGLTGRELAVESGGQSNDYTSQQMTPQCNRNDV